MNRTLTKKITEDLKDMSPEKLKVIEDFVSYLKERESSQATAELLSIPGFMERLKVAKSQAKSGRTKPWRKVHRNV